MNTAFYDVRNRTVKPYVPVALRANAPFASAYAKPAAPQPTTEAVAAVLNAMAGVAARTLWIDGYHRGGRVVRGHWRRRAAPLTVDAADVAAMDAWDDAHGWAVGI